MLLRVKRLHADAVLPAYAYPGDAGSDLVLVESAILAPGEARDLAVGFAIELPIGYWALIQGRSSTLRKRGLFVNPGVIDNGYRGPLFVYVRNDTKEPVAIESGDRLAQLILLPYALPVVQEVIELSWSARGASGFGSTGLVGEQDATWATSTGALEQEKTA